jgi:hypothetical protein
MDSTPYVDLDVLKSVLNVKRPSATPRSKLALRAPRREAINSACDRDFHARQRDRRRRGALLHARPAAHAADRRRARDPRAGDRPGRLGTFDHRVGGEPRLHARAAERARRAARSSASRCTRRRAFCSSRCRAASASPASSGGPRRRRQVVEDVRDPRDEALQARPTPRTASRRSAAEVAMQGAAHRPRLPAPAQRPAPRPDRLRVARWPDVTAIRHALADKLDAVVWRRGGRTRATHGRSARTIVTQPDVPALVVMKGPTTTARRWATACTLTLLVVAYVVDRRQRRIAGPARRAARADRRPLRLRNDHGAGPATARSRSAARAAT